MKKKSTIVGREKFLWAVTLLKMILLIKNYCPMTNHLLLKNFSRMSVKDFNDLLDKVSLGLGRVTQTTGKPYHLKSDF